MPTDRCDGLGQRGHRVVRVAHRAVTGGAVGTQPQPRQTLLGGLHQVDPAIVDGGREATDLPDPLGATLEPLGLLVDHRVRTLLAPCLLVGGERERDRPIRHGSGSRPGPDDGKDRGVEVLHVHRAAAPDVPVMDLAGERVDLPVRSTSRYDVEVAVQQQPVLGVGVPPMRDEGRAPGRRFEELRRDPDLVQQGSRHAPLRPLPRTRIVPVVGGVDPDQVAADVDDFGIGCVLLRHAPILHPPRGLAAAPLRLRFGGACLLGLCVAHREVGEPRTAAQPTSGWRNR